MTSLRPFNARDIFSFNPTNLDPLTETYELGFYLSYLARWPHLFNIGEGQDGSIDAYLMGKLESSPNHLQHSKHYLPFHAHITVLTVAPHARRLGLARTLSQVLERSGDGYNAWFVDLFVGKSNKVALALYRGMGYSVYRRVRDYYFHDPLDPSKDGEDGLDMRKPLRRDKDLAHVRENGEDFEVEGEDVF